MRGNRVSWNHSQTRSHVALFGVKARNRVMPGKFHVQTKTPAAMLGNPDVEVTWRHSDVSWCARRTTKSVSQVRPQRGRNNIHIPEKRINFEIIQQKNIPAPMRSNLAHEFSCACCASAYVGMTSRNFYFRVFEYRSRSFHFNLTFSMPAHSAVRLHAEQCDVTVSESDFKIFGSTSGVMT
jgi:hypothetical protein